MLQGAIMNSLEKVEKKGHSKMKKKILAREKNYKEQNKNVDQKKYNEWNKTLNGSAQQQKRTERKESMNWSKIELFPNRKKQRK